MSSKEEKKIERCWRCRKPKRSKKNIYCSKCEKLPDRGKSSVGTLVIYDKM